MQIQPSVVPQGSTSHACLLTKSLGEAARQVPLPAAEVSEIETADPSPRSESTPRRTRRRLVELVPTVPKSESDHRTAAAPSPVLLCRWPWMSPNPPLRSRQIEASQSRGSYIEERRSSPRRCSRWSDPRAIWRQMGHDRAGLLRTLNWRVVGSSPRRLTREARAVKPTRKAGRR